jgi:Tfp pilus assembly PilM family ATPase
LARFLALDWDHDILHVVSANLGRGGAQVQRAAVWLLDPGAGLNNPDALAQILRQKLKEAGIAPAPVLVSLGRDRVILKDVRFPHVPPSEEPALVRFQASKDLTDAPEDVVIDYYPVPGAGPNGDRRALAFIVRRKLLTGYQNLCRAAGLKLAGLAPRPFGIAACVERSAGALPLTEAPPLPDGAVAVLTLTAAWAEFCVVRGGTLLFTRTLAAGDGLLAEIRRNLALYAGQPQVSAAKDRVQALYVAGNGEHNVLREQLEQLLAIPVHPLDPFAGVERLELTGNRGGFAGAVGLLNLQAEASRLPVNFTQPREPKAERDPNRTRYLLAAGLAVAVALGAFMFGSSVLRAQRAKQNELQAELEDREERLLPLKKDSEHLKELRAQVGNSVHLLELMDEVSQRFPDTKNMNITELRVTPLSKLGPGKRPVTQMEVVGEFSGSEEGVNSLADWLHQGTESRLHRIALKTITPPADARSVGKFTIRVEIEKEDPAKDLAKKVTVGAAQKPVRRQP